MQVKFAPPAPLKTVRAGPEDVLGSLRTFIEWRRAWGKAVGLAWSDPAKYEGALIGNPAAFLETYCNYVVPATTKITVRKDNNAKYDQGLDEWLVEQTELIIHLPEKPTDPAVFGVALNCYLSAGLDNSASFCCC